MPREFPVLAGCFVACERMRALAVLAAEHSAFGEVGPHLRHAIEHFELLLDAIPIGCVDYSARTRGAALERDPRAFEQALSALVDRFAALTRRQLTAAIEVEDVVAPGLRQRTTSSLARELAFASSHAVHHLALAGVRLERRGVAVPAALVKAFSTQDHERRGAPALERVS